MVSLWSKRYIRHGVNKDSVNVCSQKVNFYKTKSYAITSSYNSRMDLLICEEMLINGWELVTKDYYKMIFKKVVQ